MSGERRPRGTVVNADPSPGEVEELLRAAQDDLLLKLSVDTHTTSSLDPDLSRRFHALRSHRGPPVPKPETKDGPSNPQDGGGCTPTAGTSAAGDGAGGGRGDGEDEVSKVLGDDLAARFAALKGSSSSHLPAGSVARRPERIPKEGDGGGDDSDKDESEDGDDGDGVSKKEVEKLMQWAMDAARLDPDPGSSGDEEGIEKEEVGGGGGGGGLESELDNDDDDDAAAMEEDERKKKMNKEEKSKKAEGKKTPTPTRKWFFF